MDKTPEQDFEFHLIAYANEWELGNWGDEKDLRSQLEDSRKRVDLLREALSKTENILHKSPTLNERALEIIETALSKTENPDTSTNSAHSFTEGSDL